MADGCESRRKERSTWPIQTFRLGEEPAGAPGTSPAQRVAMMWQLACEAWAFAGRPLPDYGRDEIPARLFRPGEAPPDDDF